MPIRRSTYIPYLPGHPPTYPGDITRATWDELYIIAQSLIDLDRPVSLTAVGDEDIPEAEEYERLLDNGEASDWEQPPGTWDGSTGIYECPQSGLYQVTCVLSHGAFDVPGNREYTIRIRARHYYVSGGYGEGIFEGGGSDEIGTTLTSQYLVPCAQGDYFTFDGWSSLASPESDPFRVNLMIVRMSAVR